MKQYIREFLFLFLITIIGVGQVNAKTVYFVNTPNWSNVTCHNWDGGTGTDWPGQAMTNTGKTYNGSSIWSVDIDDNNRKCIFSNNGANQTGDLTIGDGDETKVVYIYNSTWITAAAAGLETEYTTYIGIHTNIKISSWKTHQFSVSDNTATYTFTDVSAGDYEFGMRIGKDDNWTANGSSITRQNSTMTVASGGANNKFKADMAGDYTFTYNLTTKLLTVTYPGIVTYTVTFNANGHGTASSAQTVNSGDKATRPTDPTASGYTFGGWYTNAECTGTAYDFNTVVTSNLTLYAKWTATVVPNSCYALHAEFLNWSNAMKFTESPDGKTASCTYTVSEAQSLEKAFGLRELKSCDNTNDQVAWWYATNNTVITQTTTIQLYKETTSNCSNPKILLDRVGSYVFTLEYATMKLTVTYPAIVTCTVTFNANGHGTAPNVQTVNSGDKAAKPTDPMASGYMFGGWYTNAECTGTAYDFNTAVTSDFTLYAKWLPAIERPELYYMDEKVTDWGDEKGIQMSWNDEDHLYAYIYRPAYSGTDNKFKIYPQNKHDDNLAYFGDSYINNGFAGTDIPLSADAEWHNAKIGSTTSSYYVFLFMPNTSVNPSDKHILCAGYSLPVISDPYPVSFGVIGNQGGALTAKSGNRVIDSGDAVMSATFTAVPETGYTVEGWYTDIDGINRIDAAGTETVYTLSPVTEDNSQVYVRFRQLTAVYFKQNGLNWNDVYLYLFSADAWNKEPGGNDHPENQKGVQPKNHRIGDVLQMKRVRDDIYGQALTGQLPLYLAFSKNNQSGNNDLYQTEAVYQYQFNPDMSLFVHERGMAAYRTNEVNYYNDGIWMKYNSTESGYSLVWRQGNAETRVPFTAATAGGYKFEAVVQATAGQTYTLCVTNGRNEWYSVGDNAILQGDEEAYRLYKWGDWASSPAYVSFTPSHSGDYTITLSLADGKVAIGFGEEPGDAYRLVYVERNGTAQVVCHPSHSVIPRMRVAVGSLVGDTISMHVRPMCKDAAGVESANPNTCEVWLQKQPVGGTETWTTVEIVNVKQHASITGNGVYNFVLRKSSDDNNIGVSEIYPYTGVYYIRSDAAKRRGGVGFSNLNYIGNVMNRCYYSEYARNNEAFDYYYCEWVTKGTNVRFTLATPYSYCIADTLVRNAYEISNGFVGSDGKLSNNANVRFMWNSYDNSLNRAYLAGAGENVQLLSNGGIYKEAEGGNPQTKVCLKDRQNWVYRADMYADANTFVKVLAPYEHVNQYLKGKEGDFAEENVYKLLGGKQTSRYKIRVLYDFKTNHLICSWLPGNQQITEEDEIETDLMIIRKNHGIAEQLTFDPNSTKLKKVNTAYFVLVLTKEYLEGNASSKDKSIYWMSFPFDVMLSEVFGGGLEYGNDYMVQYYDGAARADNGCWSDSPTYWKYYEETAGVKLKKGFGYVIVLDWKRINERFFVSGNEEVCIYFPSANKEPVDISGKLVSVDVPEHPCSIKRDNRYIYDSHWNLIGAPSFANIDEFGNPMPMEQIGDYKVGFLYKYDPNQICYNVNEAESIDFMSTYAYMVQFAGTINWQDKSYSGTLPKELQARRVAGEEECYTLRLALSSNENRLDQTYVRFRDGEATCEFDLNIDLTKIDNAGASLYTFTDGNAIRVAANVQPVPVAMKQIPVGLSLTHDGEYTFTLPDGTEGMSVVLFDTETGIRTNLLFDSYTVTLAKGTYEQRFVLEVNPKQHIITASDNVGTEDNTICKYLINGNLYIRKADRLYDVQGRQVRAW